MGGQFFFHPENPLLLVLLFAATVPLIAGVLYPVYGWKKVIPAERPLAAVCVALPALALDVLSVLWFPWVFPNLPPTASSCFAAWLLWGYFLILATGIMPLQAPGYESASPGV
ncbi:MAG TPA: DUF5367 domain-containing protein [Candidatus Caenarcaniphilales bacterium]